MPDKKRVMSDMVVNKKPVIQKQVLPMAKKIEKKVEFVPPIEEREEQFIYHQEPPRKNRSGCFIWFIAIICILALILGIGGLFTYAEISVTPKQFSGAVDTTIILSQNREPGTVFFGTATKTFTSEKVVPSIGTTPTEVRATGTVKFYNTNTIAKTVSAKTEITSTTGKKYTLNKTITIPAKGIKNPGQADGAVTAVVAGAEGNSGLDDFTFSKPSKTLAGITIHSVTEISGGANSSDSVADPEALAVATEKLKQEFGNTQNLITRLSEQVPDTMIALPLVLPENSLSVKTDPKYSDGVHVIASQNVTILVVNRSDIARVLGNDLDVSKDIKLTVKDLRNISVMANGLVAGQVVPEKLQIRITGDAKVSGAVNTQEIESKILGISRKELKKYMSQKPEIDSYKVKMRPPWRRVVPMGGNDVEVIEK